MHIDKDAQEEQSNKLIALVCTYERSSRAQEGYEPAITGSGRASYMSHNARQRQQAYIRRVPRPLKHPEVTSLNFLKFYDLSRDTK